MAQLTKIHPIESKLLQCWVDNYNNLQYVSDITEFISLVKSWIEPDDNEQLTPFKHPLWTVLKEYNPYTKHCSQPIIEYYLWIVHQLEWEDWSCTKRLNIFWNPLFNHIADVNIPIGTSSVRERHSKSDF